MIKRPSMIAIYKNFYSFVTSAVCLNGAINGGLQKPLKDSGRIILQIFGIPEGIYYRKYM